MAVQVEIWQNDIVNGLWAANPFIQQAVNADQYVLGGHVVHIPQAGAAPAIKKNRNVFPAVATQRGDTDVTYVLEEYSSDPIHIQDAEQAEISYDKRASVLEEMQNALNDSVADNMLYNWGANVAAANILKTTGDAVAAHATSATGSRKALTVADFMRAMTAMNQSNVPNDNRFVLLDGVMYEQFLNDLKINGNRDFSQVLNTTDGSIGKFFGFSIYVRSKALRLTAAGATKLPEAAGAATDNAGAIFWQKSTVERALGTVKFFEDLGNPLYYGDIYSALVRMGGRARRQDGKGVILMTQDVAA